MTAASRPLPAARSNDRSHRSSAIAAKPASPRIRRTRSSSANANGPGSSGPSSGSFGTCLVGRHQRQHHPWIVARCAPAGKSHAAARAQRLAHVGERQHGISKEHHAEPRDQEIEACRLRTHARSRPQAQTRTARLQAQSRAPAPASAPRYRRRAHARAARPCSANAKVVAPQPQPISTTRSPACHFGALDQDVGHGSEHDVLHLLPTYPVLAAGTIPVGDLVGVSIVSGRHGPWRCSPICRAAFIFSMRRASVAQ